VIILNTIKNCKDSVSEVLQYEYTCNIDIFYFISCVYKQHDLLWYM